MAVVFEAVRDFLVRKEYHSSVKLCGKTVIITGANAGLGKETALDLAARGVAVCPRSKTTDGFEMQFGVNYLGHFFLTNLLLERIKESAPARIVNVGSVSHILGKIHFSDIHMERGYNSVLAYCHSKLATVLFTRELAKNLKGTGVTAYCVDPGPADTNIFRHMFSTINCISHPFSICRSVMYKSPKKGAQTIIYCAVEGSLAEETGLYYCGCRKVQASSRARDDVLARRLWDFSEHLIDTVG